MLEFIDFFLVKTYSLSKKEFEEFIEDKIYIKD